MDKKAIKLALKSATNLEGLDLKSVKASAAGLSEWVAGLPLDVYRPDFDDNGDLVTFNTADNKKVAGYYVVGEKSGKRKLYKKFNGLLEGVPGCEVVKIKETEYLFPINSTFGIKASEDTSRPKESYQGTERHPLKHEVLSPVEVEEQD